jgi:transposase
MVKTFLSSPNHLVFFFDEGRFGTQPDVARLWALKGRRPYTKIRPGYQNFYLYSSVSPHKGEGFTLFLPWVNTEMMNLYLRELSAAYPNHELLLIMDQAGWHKSNNLIIPDNIQIECLPPYSPELNPVERLWQWLRRHVCRNGLFDSAKQLADALQKTLIEQLSPDKLVSLCQCSYL